MVGDELCSFEFWAETKQVAIKTQNIHTIMVRNISFDIAAVFSRILSSWVIGIEIVLVSRLVLLFFLFGFWLFVLIVPGLLGG